MAKLKIDSRVKVLLENPIEIRAKERQEIRVTYLWIYFFSLVFVLSLLLIIKG